MVIVPYVYNSILLYLMTHKQRHSIKWKKYFPVVTIWLISGPALCGVLRLLLRCSNYSLFSVSVESLLEEGLNKVTNQDWEKYVDHVKEDKLWKLDDTIEVMKEESRRFVKP